MPFCFSFIFLNKREKANFYLFQKFFLKFLTKLGFLEAHDLGENIFGGQKMIYIIWVYQEVYETVGHTFIQALQVTFGSPKKKALVICQNIGNWCENESTISAAYLIIVIFFTLTQFLENKIYTQKNA